MNNSLELADTLQGYMETSGFRSSRLANAVNKTFNQPLISKTTIDNWTSGVSKSARDWHQIIAIAHVLHIDEEGSNRLLAASGHQTSIRELWLNSEKENNAEDRLYLERWMKPLPLQSIHNDLRELTAKVSTIHDYVKQNADPSSSSSPAHDAIPEWQINSTEDVIDMTSSTNSEASGTEAFTNPVLERGECTEVQDNESVENQAWMVDTDGLEQINTDWKYNEGSVTNLFPTREDQKIALPPATHTHLFGVENIIQRLYESLQTDRSPWVSALIGLGGTGKTAVSHAVAQRIIEEGTFDQVIWITIDQEAAPLAMDKVVVILGEYLIPHQLDHTSQKRRFLQVKKALKAHRYLIIIDNLERSSDLSDLLTHLVDWSQPSKFLLTMRPFPPPDIDIFALQLNELSTPDALRLLRHQIDTIGASQFSQPDTKNLEDIVAIVGGHPQALRLIAGLVRIQPISQIKINIQTANLNRISVLYDDIYKQAWQILQPAEKQLLATISSVTRTGTTAPHLKAISFIRDDLFWPTITNLIELSLVEQKQGSMPRFGLHSLTTQFLSSQRLQVAEGETNAFWSIELLITNLNYWQHLVESGRLDSTLFKIESRNLLHAIHTGLLSTETWSPAVNLLLNIFQLIEQSGYWEEWLIAMKKAVTTSTDETQQLKYRLLNRMGYLYKLNQDFDQAITNYTKAEALAIQIDDKKAIAQAQLGLGQVYRYKRAYNKAEHYGLQALAGFTNLGLEEQYLASTLNTLGLIAYARGEFEIAEQYLTSAVPHWYQTNDLVGLARTLNHLGNLMQATNNFKKAVGFHNEALAKAEQENSEIDKVMISLSLGTLYYNQDDFDNAEAVFRQADTPYLQQSEHLYYRASLANNIGNTLLAKKKYREAELYIERSIALWRELNDQLMLANTLGILGETLAKQERFVEALPYYEEATTLLENNVDSSLAKKLYLDFSQQQREIEMKVA